VKKYETLKLEVIAVDADILLASNVADSAYVTYDPSFDPFGFLQDDGE